MGEKSTQEKLDDALKECSKLRQENELLRKRLGLSSKDSILLPQIEEHSSQEPAQVTNNSSATSKIKLFRRLFKGREDVYPVRWENKSGKSGYSPACRHEWDRAYCDKPRVKCGQCNNREFLPVTDKVIYDHLAGKHTIGVYPLLPDDTCWFLAADFDKKNWQDDVSVFLQTCNENNVPAAIEKSRSGNGGHVWIFFTEVVPSSIARQVGCYLLTLSMERSPQIGLDSYDRFFPNQDTLPKGGFGNLIALPLQKGPRANGNSVFLDTSFNPVTDQWAFLSNVQTMSKKMVEDIAAEACRKGGILGVRGHQILDNDTDDDPWTVSTIKKSESRPIKGPLPGKIDIVLADLLYVEKNAIPAALQDRLIRIAAFPNPEFYKNQAMRLPTYDKPRIISCSEDFPKHIGLPRGCLSDVIELLKSLDIEPILKDERTTGKPLKVSFKGQLRDLQKPAVKNLRSHDIGILSAATAFGKTVVAAKIIAVRKRSTLVLVHRRQLLDQWRERLSMFLDIPEKDIGQIGDGKKKITERLDIGILQSFYRKGQVDEIVSKYGQIIVDECHHLSAFSFEQVMKKAKAKFVLGLTATPIRKDGHHPIVIMQCGPIRFRVEAKSAAEARPFDHIMIPRFTEEVISLDEERPSIQEIYRLLAANEVRNKMIVEDVLQAVGEGRSPLVLTERTDHLQLLADLFEGKVNNVVRLRGGMGKKQRIEVAKSLDDIGDNKERVIVATGRYIGEGFDDPRLDTLFLGLPISWKGTLQQYAGRLHRNYDGKKEVRIYDYIDAEIPMLMRMYDRRLKGYKAIGYNIQSVEKTQYERVSPKFQ